MKTRRATSARFDDAARRALAHYDVGQCRLTFIRHSDTVAYRVQGASAYLLRIHVPATSAMGAHGSDPVAVRSELQWLEALNRDTDLVLQRPIRNRAGALVTQVSLENDVVPVNCTLLRWVRGQPYHRDLEAPQPARHIGETLANLHLHASRWQVPDGFSRPRRDVPYFERVLRGIQPALRDGRISPSDYAEFERSIALLTGRMRSLPEDPQAHGIMHADAHKGNMLYDDGQIRLIDFSFCAFGHYLFDLGICLSDMKEELHAAFLEEYQGLRPLPDGYEAWIEGFFIGSVVGTFSFWVANPRAQELLAHKVPQVARDYSSRFNRGEHFWFA